MQQLMGGKGEGKDEPTNGEKKVHTDVTIVEYMGHLPLGGAHVLGIDTVEAFGKVHEHHRHNGEKTQAVDFGNKSGPAGDAAEVSGHSSKESDDPISHGV